MDNQGNLSQITKLLEGVTYPLTKQDLLSHAQKQGASEAELKTLQGLPDQVFNTVDDLTGVLNKLVSSTVGGLLDKLL